MATNADCHDHPFQPDDSVESAGKIDVDRFATASRLTSLVFQVGVSPYRLAKGLSKERFVTSAKQ